MRAQAVRTLPAPAISTRAELFRDAALWSLRALLAAFVLMAFALSPPAASHVSLSVELGRRVVTEHAFGLGWLSSLEAWAVGTASGFGGLAAVAGMGTVAALALVEFRARRRAGAILSLGATILTALTFFDTLRVGGGAPVWLFAAAFMLALERRRGAWLAIGIALVWCNASPSGLLAPLLAGLVAIGRTIDRGARAPGTVAAWTIALGAAVAACATPDGLSFFRDSWIALHFDRRVLGLVPILPPEVAPSYRFGLTAIVVIAACLWNYRRRTDDVLLTLAGVVLVFVDGTFLPLLGIVAAPGFAATAGRLAPALVTARPTPRERWAAAAVAAVAIGLAASFASAPNERGLRPTPEQAAEQTAIARVASDERSHVLLCGVALWCDYAAPFRNVRVVLDERVERAAPDVWTMEAQVSHVRTGWRKALDDARVDAVIARRKTALGTLLPMGGFWKELAGDDSFVLLVRTKALR